MGFRVHSVLLNEGGVGGGGRRGLKEEDEKDCKNMMFAVTK